MKNTIYTVIWEILRSGRLREFTTFDYEEYRNKINAIENNNRYKIIEFYAMELIEL